MNTKFIMGLCAFWLAIIGMSLTFLPNEIAGFFGILSTISGQLVLQILGAMYLGFAMLNWMAKGSHIGGIYNRPIAISNFSHFLIGGLAMVKALIKYSDLPDIFWLLAGLYSIFAVLFGLMLFHSPTSNKKLTTVQ